MNLGEQLKSLREQHNMSREELAQQMNVSRQAVYKWETNKGYPDIDNLIKLSELYDITLDKLIKGDRVFQKKINIGEGKKHTYYSDPGYYLGMILIAIGLLFPIEGLTILGFIVMGCYSEIKKALLVIKKDWVDQK